MEKHTAITLRIPPDVHERLKDRAKREQRTVTTVALRAFQQYLETEVAA